MEKDIIVQLKKNVNHVYLKDILSARFPEYDVQLENADKENECVRIKKSFFVHVLIAVSHSEDTGKTTIGIDGSMDDYAAYFFGVIMHYIFRGDILCQIELAISNEINKL